MKGALLAVLISMLSIGSVWANEPVSEIYVESVVMGTDGQMRARINGEYLTRQSDKQGIKVLDMDYKSVTVRYQGKIYTIQPGSTLNLSPKP